MSAKLTVEDCILDDLRTLPEEGVGKEGEEYDDDGSTRESSVDTIDIPEKQCNKQRIRRYLLAQYVQYIIQYLDAVKSITRLENLEPGGLNHIPPILYSVLGVESGLALYDRMF